MKTKLEVYSFETIAGNQGKFGVQQKFLDSSTTELRWSRPEKCIVKWPFTAKT